MRDVAAARRTEWFRCVNGTTDNDRATRDLRRWRRRALTPLKSTTGKTACGQAVSRISLRALARKMSVPAYVGKRASRIGRSAFSVRRLLLAAFQLSTLNS